MKICRFDNNCLGLVEGGQVRDVTAALDSLPTDRDPLPAFDPLIANLEALVVVIGKAGRNIARADAHLHIAGYSSGLDMTTRGPEDRSLRESIDTYSVLGPWFVTADDIADSGKLGFSLTVNEQLKQKANTSDLIYTGTSEGVGPVVPGNVIVTGFDGIGRMQVAVTAAKQEAI